MTDREQLQRTWASKLQRWGLAGLASALLEGNGAFATIAAQGLYVSQPLLESWMPAQAMAAMLEDPQEARKFVSLLREVNQ